MRKWSASREALVPDLLFCHLQQREHVIDGKKVEAKAAVPKNSGNSPMLTRKMFVGGTVRGVTFDGNLPDVDCMLVLSHSEHSIVQQGEISDEEFRDYFLGFGEIEDSVVSFVFLDAVLHLVSDSAVSQAQHLLSILKI